MGWLTWLAGIPTNAVLRIRNSELETKLSVLEKKLSVLSLENENLKALVADRDKEINKLRDDLERCRRSKQEPQQRFPSGPNAWMGG